MKTSFFYIALLSRSLMSSSDDYSSLKKEIQETMKTYTELLETISEKESNEINQTLWKNLSIQIHIVY